MRTEKTSYLKNIKISYNYRLIDPTKNLVTREDCLESKGASFLKFEDSFRDDVLKATMSAPVKVDKLFHFLKDMFEKSSDHESFTS